jgi:cell division protein FtsB
MSAKQRAGKGQTPRRRRATPDPRGREADFWPALTFSSSKTTSSVSRTAKAAAGTGRSGAHSSGRSRGGPSRPTGSRSTSSRPATASRGRTAVPLEERGGSAWVRAAILLTILVVLAVTLAPTARSLLRQRGEIAALQDKVVQQQQNVADLQREQGRWADPAYVEQQARERLKFVKVGDRSYSVIDPATEVPKPPASAVVAAPQADANAPWYGQLWQSVRLADQPSAGMAPVPDK